MSTQPRVHVLWAEFPVEPRVDTQAIGPMMDDDALSGVSTQIKTRQAPFVALLALSLLRPALVLMSTPPCFVLSTQPATFVMSSSAPD